MDYLLTLAADPSAWLALITLVAMEVVLGVDNIIFIALLSSKLPAPAAAKARQAGLGLSLVLRLILVTGAAYAIRLTAPLFAVSGQQFSVRDLILIFGGLFLVFKATLEIHHAIEPFEAHHSPRSKHLSFRVTAGQIV
ncbi:MAG: TerC family protein, partial [Methylocapsa sp.]|nr:TerC family protein [Methylocapsa sp.]